MDNTSVNPAKARWNIDSIATAGIWIVIAYTAVKNILAAASKPFWFDEFMTVAVAHQPNFASIWRALLQAKDSSPLLFVLLEHFCALLVPNAEIAYRLPSIVGFGCVLWCLFVFIREQEGSVCAFFCALIPILTPLYRHYATEARSYTLVVACISIALICYQRATQRSWIIFFGLALTFAEAFHYYAFFAFVPFGIAEFALTVREKKIRWGIWLALAAGFLPLLVSWPLLREMKSFYGENYWSKSNFYIVQDAYDGVLKPFGLLLFPGIGFLFAALLSCASILAGLLSESSNLKGKARSFYEPFLGIGFLGVPFVALVVTSVGHGPLTGRYFLPMALGTSIATSYVVRPLRYRRFILFAFVAILFLGIGRQDKQFWKEQHEHWAGFPSPADSLAALLNSSGQPDLPVMASDAQEYIQFAYYAHPELARRLLEPVDPSSATKYLGFDSIDRELLAVTCCFSNFHVREYRGFVEEHPSFLLYSDGSGFARWSDKLKSDGYTMDAVASDGDKHIYRVHRN